MLVPGLTIDPDGNYEVEATKAGYSSAHQDRHRRCFRTRLQEVVLTIDLRVVPDGPRDR